MEVASDGRVGEDLVVSSGTLTVAGTVDGNVAGTTSTYSVTGTIGGEDAIAIRQEGAPSAPTVADRAVDGVTHFIAVVLVGLLALWLAPMLMARAETTVRARPLVAAGVGLLGFIGFVVLLIVVTWVVYRNLQPAAPPPPAQTLPSTDDASIAIQRVVDGDTLLLPDGRRLRLIGINCPESVKPDHPVEPFGPEASDFTKEFIGGSKVRLQFDREREDQYGRLLAYVFVGDKLLNEELIRAGLARYEPHYRYSEAMKRRFKAAQEEAQDAKQGIWSQGK